MGFLGVSMIRVTSPEIPGKRIVVSGLTAEEVARALLQRGVYVFTIEIEDMPDRDGKPIWGRAIDSREENAP